MIAFLKGSLIRKTTDNVTLDVNGVGYQVFIPLSTYYDLPDQGGEVSFHIHAHIREDAFKLFGFLTDQEKKIFETLIGINKVGPKLALTILSGMSVQALKEAISSEDIARLSAIPGVGRKTAERLALELKDKLEKIETHFTPSSGPATRNGLLDDALSALINLGYKKPVAEQALKNVWKKGEGNPSLEDLIKESLNFLS